MKVIGDRIKAIRKEKGMSQSDLAKILNADRSNVSKWERGIVTPNNERLKKIADIGGISVDELLHGSIEEQYKKAFNDNFKLHIQNKFKDADFTNPVFLEQLKELEEDTRDSFFKILSKSPFLLKSFDERVVTHTLGTAINKDITDNDIITNLSFDVLTLFLKLDDYIEVVKDDDLLKVLLDVQNQIDKIIFIFENFNQL